MRKNSDSYMGVQRKRGRACYSPKHLTIFSCSIPHIKKSWQVHVALYGEKQVLGHPRKESHTTAWQNK